MNVSTKLRRVALAGANKLRTKFMTPAAGSFFLERGRLYCEVPARAGYGDKFWSITNECAVRLHIYHNPCVAPSTVCLQVNFICDAPD